MIPLVISEVKEQKICDFYLLYTIQEPVAPFFAELVSLKLF